MSRVVTLKINDRDVSGRDDETILELATENGIYIPTLCHLEGCRISVPAGCVWSKLKVWRNSCRPV